MKKSKLSSSVVLFVLLLVLAAGAIPSALADTATQTLSEALASVTIAPDRIEWQPGVQYAVARLTVAAPGERSFEVDFDAATNPSLGLVDPQGHPLADGIYRYELQFLPAGMAQDPAATDQAQRGLTPTGAAQAQVQSGSFAIQNGAFVLPKPEVVLEAQQPREADVAPMDVVHYDDLIVTGSLCTGFDCVNGESFGFDTYRLKENNLRIHFQDTSSSASFPTRDWRIVANDSTNGGASYFGIEDTDGGRMPFRIEAGAPAHSLYVEDYGRVGLGTSTPVVELHIADGDTPTVRLDQDGSGGWSPQVWDMAGNESNFFIRDATNGSKLSFRIQPNTPSDTLTLKSSGYVGVGTWSPEWPLEVETTSENAVILAERTDGATGYMSGASSRVYFGSKTNHRVSITVNNTIRATFGTDGSFTLEDGNLTVNGNSTVTGSKSAVVPTDKGDRLMYSEESTEVWFTDYGFGQLQDGVAIVAIDSLFAQTVNLDEPYHVFVEEYGAAEMYVSQRTAEWFEVRLVDGDPNAEFSYRLVAKRLGYEEQSMEPAP